MTNKSEPAEPAAIIKPRRAISAVWLVPIIAVLFGTFLLVKAYSDKGIFITVQFDSASGIVVGKTQVKYKGLTAGVVRDVDISEDLQSVIVEIEMISSTKKMLTDKALFWYVTADVSIQGVTGLDTLFSGSYIDVQPDVEGKGKPKRHFIGLPEEPILDKDVPGLHISVQTNTLGSLAKNSPVSFKQITVGHVSGFKFDEDTEKVNINLFIEPEYAHLVKENSQFWNASGVTVSGSLTSGVQVKTDSIASLIAGGIAFDNANHEVAMPPSQNGQVFTLHQDYLSAEMGHEIQLVLDWNSGVDRGTSIVYQGITFGKVIDYTNISAESRKITARAKIDPRVIPYLNTKSQFYVVNAQLDLGGVTNLHNLLKGAHIGIRPSLEGEPLEEFVVYSQKPAYEYSEPGLHLILHTDDVGSLTVTTGVYYKQQNVGNIQAIENIGIDEFLVHIYIKPKYQHFVSEDSRFWNTSGIRVEGGLQEFEIQAQSLQSVLNGGIAFDNGKNSSEEKPNNGDSFKLFPNIDMAKQRIPFQLHIDSAKGLSPKTRIMYRGEEIGSLHQVSREKDITVLQMGLLPEFEYILRENSQFWMVRPDVSLSGITDTDALFGGAYITVNVGEGKVHKEFYVSNEPPAKHISSRGLQLSLTTERGNVVRPGSPISYRGIPVGQVDNVSLIPSGNNVEINITIDEEYRHLISNFTRFYNASGVTVTGGIGNFTVKTESADSIMRGGISFYNSKDLEERGENDINEGEKFILFNNVHHAELAGISIKIHFNEVSGLTSNLKIKYQDQQVGMISRMVFDEKGYGATVYAFLTDTGRKFAVNGTKFWFAKPALGLVGSRHVTSILDGGFINLLPGKGEAQTVFIANDTPPVVSELTYGLNIKLSAEHLGSIRTGNPVLYRQVKVGSVIGVDLSETADTVDIYVNVYDRYAPLVTERTKFWNTSGVRIDAGIFSGVNIDSESIETLMSGGVAFATPEDENGYSQVSQGHQFNLSPNLDEDWHDWQPKIAIKD